VEELEALIRQQEEMKKLEEFLFNTRLDDSGSSNNTPSHIA